MCSLEVTSLKKRIVKKKGYEYFQRGNPVTDFFLDISNM